MKGILIVDNMPQGCNECKYLGFQGETEKRACMLTTNSLFIQNVDDLDIGRDISCPLKSLGRKVEEYGLETWNTSDGIFLCEKGLFDKIYGDEEE